MLLPRRSVGPIKSPLCNLDNEVGIGECKSFEVGSVLYHNTHEPLFKQNKRQDSRE
jgi:hypothetical protein